MGINYFKIIFFSFILTFKWNDGIGKDKAKSKKGPSVSDN